MMSMPMPVAMVTVCVGTVEDEAAVLYRDLLKLPSLVRM